MTAPPAGFFAASRKGTDLLSVVQGLKSYSVAQFYHLLHRPDLVAEMLEGDWAHVARDGKALGYVPAAPARPADRSTCAKGARLVVSSW